MISRRGVWGRWIVVFVAAAAIYYFSGRPVIGAVVPPFAHADKVMHALAYAVFAALILRALWADDARPVAVGVLVLGVLLAAAYGATDELHQRCVPGRSCDVYDWLADAAGAAVAAAAWRKLTARFPKLK